MQREQAERQARIDRERMAEVARAQPTVANTATKAEADAKYWRDYIAKQIAQQNRSTLRAIAEVVVAEERQRKRDDDFEQRDRQQQCEEICRRFADHPRIEEFTRLRVQVAALQERLAALEAAPQPAARALKVAG